MAHYEEAVELWRTKDISNAAELSEALNGYSISFAYNSGRIENENITYYDTREIFDKDEESLDIYEGYPRLYRKENVTVKIGGRKTQVMMYVMNPGRPLGKPSAYYYATILQGYRTARFDPTYLKEGVMRSVVK